MPLPAILALCVMPFLFVGIWLGVTGLVGWLCGWYGLMRRYPDRPEAASARFAWQSGTMGAGVNLKGALTLSVCPGGLRLGIPKMLGPFSRDLFVPWSEVGAERRNRFLAKTVVLSFGVLAEGSLEISAQLGDQLADAASGVWPGPGASG